MTLAAADQVACEDTRVSGGLLSAYGIKKPLVAYHDHNAAAAGAKLLKDMADGATIAFVTDAGLPLISDPGFALVRSCRESGIPVTVIPGANAALTALAGSGIPSDRFLFAGFLPPKAAARQKVLAELKAVPATLLFHESPQRLADTLDDLAATLGPERPAAVARELTKLYEETRRGALAELAAHYRAQEPRGEIVVLVAPPEAVGPIASAHDLDALLRESLRVHSLRDAVNEVSAMTGMKKNEVYARALWMAKGASKHVGD
jgi:16S rRNA (cytidine1402-2'-O)-methyltransferase